MDGNVNLSTEIPLARPMPDLGSGIGLRRIALISNCRSGHNRDNFAKLSSLVAQCPGITHYPTSSPDEVPVLLREIAAAAPDLLAINGGDGTAAHIFGELLEHWPVANLPTLLLLPGGTANMTAGDVGCTGPLLKAVERLCRWSRGDLAAPVQMVERHVLRLQPGAGLAPRYGMFFGTGVIIEATEYAHQQIHSRGLRDDFSLGLGLVRTLWGIARGDPAFNKPLAVEMAVDDANFQPFEVRILAASSLQRLFLGTHPFWGAGDDPLKASLITSDARRFLWRFPRLLWGRPGAGADAEAGYHSVRANRIQLMMDGSVNLDGEIIPIRRHTGAAVLTVAGPLRFCQL